MELDNPTSVSAYENNTNHNMATTDLPDLSNDDLVRSCTIGKYRATTII